MIKVLTFYCFLLFVISSCKENEQALPQFTEASFIGKWKDEKIRTVKFKSGKVIEDRTDYYEANAVDTFDLLENNKCILYFSSQIYHMTWQLKNDSLSRGSPLLRKVYSVSENEYVLFTDFTDPRFLEADRINQYLYYKRLQ